MTLFMNLQHYKVEEKFKYLPIQTNIILYYYIVFIKIVNTLYVKLNINLHSLYDFLITFLFIIYLNM